MTFLKTLAFLLITTFIVIKGNAQTTKAVSTPKRYNLLLKYNIELISTSNIYREREIKTNGVNRSGDEHLQHWGNMKTIFSTQGALIGSNFEAYKDPETGIVSIASTDDTKVSTRKKDGVVGKTKGRHEVMNFDKNAYQEWVSTKFDIAHNEGYNREFVCKKHHTILGEGETPVKWDEGGNYSIQMRYNPKNQRVEIRNWLPDFDLNITGLEGFTSAGDKNCDNSLNISQDASELVSQFPLGLGQVLKNSIIYNSKEGMGDQMREIPYMDLQNLGLFAGFRFSNQPINVQAAITENRYIFDMSFKDSFREMPVNIANNPNTGAFYKREFEGKEFKIRASVMIVFQQKEVKFDDYPGEELPSEDPEHRDLGWVPLMDKDDYPPTQTPTTTNPNTNTTDKARIITIVTSQGDEDVYSIPRANTPIEGIATLDGRSFQYGLKSDEAGKIVFDANECHSKKANHETINFYASSQMNPTAIIQVPLYGPDTTIYFKEYLRRITIKTQYKSNKQPIANQHFDIINAVTGDSIRNATQANGQTQLTRFYLAPFTRANQQNILKFSIDSMFVPSQIQVPVFGSDTTIVFEKISPINQSTITGDIRSTISEQTQALPSINIKIEQAGDNNIVQTFPRRVEVVVSQEFNYQTTKVGEINIVPQPPANLKVYPPYRTITVPRGENEIRVPTFLTYPRNTPVYKVIGTVQTHAGMPVKEAEVGLDNLMIATTDAQGKFTVYLSAGTYSISVPDCETSQQSITIVNQDITLNFIKK